MLFFFVIPLQCMTNNVEIFDLEHPVLIKYTLIDRYPFENCLKHLFKVCFYSVFTIITMTCFEDRFIFRLTACKETKK